MNRSIVYIVLLALLSVGCANRGAGPQGGKQDSIPPTVVSSVPLNGTTDFHGKEIQIRFDEYLKLDNPSGQVLVSPPQQAQPIVKAVGKTLSVTLNDSLVSETTYSIYFGSAIQDLNESNPLKDYTFTFSTGPHIDSLTISGRVWFAQSRKLGVGTTVGIYSVDAPDSALYHQPFLRIARTDTTGRFTIRHVRAGTYRVYALQDSNRTYTYQRGEPVAFLDTPVVAPANDLTLNLFVEERNDTLFRTDTVDSMATATLRVRLVPFIPHAVLQLLTPKDETVATLWATDSAGVRFEHIKGGQYLLRMVLDANQDSLWNTGDVMQHRQAENVYYFPKQLRIRDNWDFEETFRWQDESNRPY